MHVLVHLLVFAVFCPELRLLIKKNRLLSTRTQSVAVSTEEILEEFDEDEPNQLVKHKITAQMELVV